MTSSPFRYLNREEWASLRSNTPLSLSDEELATLRSMYERLSLTEVAEVHLPLSRFLNLHVKAAQNLNLVRDAFLGRQAIRSPFVIAISVYRHAIDEFVDRYCSEPRLAFNRIREPPHSAQAEVDSSWSKLPGFQIAPVPYEAADCLLSSDLAAGIRRVKGVKKLVFALETG